MEVLCLFFLPPPLSSIPCYPPAQILWSRMPPIASLPQSPKAHLGARHLHSEVLASPLEVASAQRQMDLICIKHLKMRFSTLFQRETIPQLSHLAQEGREPGGSKGYSWDLYGNHTGGTPWKHEMHWDMTFVSGSMRVLYRLEGQPMLAAPGIWAGKGLLAVQTSPFTPPSS